MNTTHGTRRSNSDAFIESTAAVFGRIEPSTTTYTCGKVFDVHGKWTGHISVAKVVRVGTGTPNTPDDAIANFVGIQDRQIERLQRELSEALAARDAANKL